MAWTLTNTNYNGDVANNVYKDLAEGNEVIAKGCAYLAAGVSDKIALPVMDQTTRPFGAYVSSPLTANETVTTDWAERTLTVADLMIYEEFDPNDFTALWDKWKSVGPFSQIRQNPEFIRDVLALTAPNAGAHLSELFFAGDTASGTPKLALMDGIIKIATADAGVVDVTPAGAITSVNVFTILQAVIDAIPDKDYLNEDYKILMSIADFRILQRANSALKQANDALLDDTFKDMLESKRIIPFVGMPKDRIIATKATNTEDSNLWFGFWFDENAEADNLRIDRIANNSDDFFMKLNIKVGAQYRKSENVILYLPA